MGLAGDGHPQGTAVGEVDLGLPPRGMLLGEVDLLVRTVRARQSCNRRCMVRTWEGPKRPGCRSASHSIIVVALSLPAGSPRRRGSISSSHTPRRDLAWCATALLLRLGRQRPLCHFRADRTLIPAMAAAVSWVFPSIRFCLNNATCRSVINPALRAG